MNLKARQAPRDWAEEDMLLNLVRALLHFKALYLLLKVVASIGNLIRFP